MCEISLSEHKEQQPPSHDPAERMGLTRERQREHRRDVTWVMLPDARHNPEHSKTEAATSVQKSHGRALFNALVMRFSSFCLRLNSITAGEDLGLSIQEADLLARTFYPGLFNDMAYVLRVAVWWQQQESDTHRNEKWIQHCTKRRRPLLKKTSLHTRLDLVMLPFGTV